jgi:hypothetical protein
LKYASKDNAHFEIPSLNVLGYPETPNMLNAAIDISIDGTHFTINAPLSYKKLDPTHGDVIEPLRIVPDASIEFTDGLIITRKDGSIHASVKIHPNKDISNTSVVMYCLDMTHEIKGFNLKKGIDTVIETSFTAKEIDSLTKGDFYLLANILVNGKLLDRYQHLIKYDHIPTLQYFSTAFAKVVRKNWDSKIKRIGYIAGAGDKVAEILQLAGVQIDILKEADITTANLKKYDAVLTGVRVINVEKRMNNWIHTLNEYAKSGGTVVIQYNTLQDMATTEIGPYPITLSGSRVTEEDAKVNLIDPKHKLLNYPNKITDEDFNGWVQERGLYFASKWDEHYKPLFRMNDTGEQPLDGCTLYAQYGKGHYIYTTLSFFRQLPAGNKGAIRLLMNMLSAGK